VVLPTIMPSGSGASAQCEPRRQSSARLRSGAIFEQLPACRQRSAHTLSQRLDHLGQEVVERRRLLQVAQARRVRDER